MAQESPLSATGNLTEADYETLAANTQADGLIGHPDDDPPVRVSGGQVIVRAGLRGVLRGFPWRSGDSDTVYTPSLTGPARVDLVVLRLDRTTGYAVGTALRTGAGDVAPAPYGGTGPTDWYEIPFAEVRMSGGTLSVTKTRAWYLGQDGQIRCTVDSRPPQHDGRRIRETDTGRTYESNGLAWVVVLDDSGWTALPLASGWSSSVNRLRRLNGVVYLHLSPQRTGASITSGATVTVGTLPDGYRPRYVFESTGYAASAGYVAVRVQPTGVVEAIPFSGLAKDRYANFAAMAFPLA